MLSKKLSEKARERAYKHLYYVFGWTWRRFGRKKSMAPSDIDARILSSAEHLFTQHKIRRYNFVLFGNETAVFVDGEPRGLTLDPILQGLLIPMLGSKKWVLPLKEVKKRVKNSKGLYFFK